MPGKHARRYTSDAQRKKLNAMRARGEIDPKVVEEMNRASQGRRLPERSKPRPRKGR